MASREANQQACHYRPWYHRPESPEAGLGPGRVDGANWYGVGTEDGPAAAITGPLGFMPVDLLKESGWLVDMDAEIC
eukprot:CAMPEP_0204285752 /NCGR_PEP_ID=MMETSP0468-20130131/51364_1 /ASSEMBLY_ACC=CAM_ASM_000383 /TAXON_ID=2969 /ORGANISM="Oxyrrhis marina" /LENGTH=76 /DNA_ID=CAMNT_0051263601 /DNA_START=67 /DNA_END=297 /DNA_ORIENTATION=-